MADHSIRIAGARVVKGVECFRPELELQPFIDRKVLEDGNVFVGESGTMQRVSGSVPKGILWIGAIDVRGQRISGGIDARSHVVMDIVFQAATGVRRVEKVRPLGALAQAGAIVV